MENWRDAKLSFRPCIQSWHKILFSQIAFQVDIANMQLNFAIRIGESHRHLELAFQIDITHCQYELALQVGVANWHC